ncbi:MAG: threonine/serine dehydratase [Micromonosporaceae bacterium]
MTRADVLAAASRIEGRVRRTPTAEIDGGVLLKLEFLQHTGSFKARGAFNRILTAKESGELTDAGVIAASGGNAGMAYAYAAAALGVPAEVHLPEMAPPVKVAKLRELGASVVQHGKEFAEAYEAARRRERETGAIFGHPYDQPEVVAGQGTLALELPDDVDTVLVAVGGGGLIAGIAAALEGRADVVGVEPTTCPTMHAALEAGEPVDVEISGIAADSLGARRLGEIAYQTVVRCGVRSVLVSEDAVIDARQALWRQYRLAVEHGGAAAWAALASQAYQPAVAERVAVVMCGANTDPSDLV